MKKLQIGFFALFFALLTAAGLFRCSARSVISPKSKTAR